MRKTLTHLLCVVLLLSGFSLTEAGMYANNKGNPVNKHKSSPYLTATWYGTGHHGKISTSGKPFNMYALTAAHKYLPMGTALRVTNLRNNKSVILTITDRGPFVSGRDIDLSYEAANRLSMVKKGSGKVRIEAFYEEGKNKRFVDISGIRNNPRTILEARFENRKNALHLMKIVSSAHKKGVFLEKELVNGQVLYRIAIAGYNHIEKPPAYYVNLRRKPFGYTGNLRLAKIVQGRGVLLTLDNHPVSPVAPVVNWGLYAYGSQFNGYGITPIDKTTFSIKMFENGLS
ncbi:MAG: septal ring lytic transglycosylase RlpA family protein [Nitrospirae bacterium]|nr:septal ring lytic transglycosylase RlpA family protein [Nitrospirota bacterium]